MAEGLFEVADAAARAGGRSGERAAAQSARRPRRRTSATRLLPGLVRQVEGNWAAQVRDVRLFEVGTVFRAGEAGRAAARGARGSPASSPAPGSRPTGARRRKSPDVDLWDLKGALRGGGRSGVSRCDGAS